MLGPLAIKALTARITIVADISVRGGCWMVDQHEQHLRELASKLLFKLQKNGTRFTLTRDVDVSASVRHENLTLEEVEDILNTWKLRGPHGG
jgi:hypothetical protein